MLQHLLGRRGAARIALIPAEVLEALNQGLVPTVNLKHRSDVARSWAAQWVMFSRMPVRRKLAAVRRFAADVHFGVREVAWMAVRADVATAVDEAIALLQPWVHEADANIRRFASELTRPRGVWCAQIVNLRALDRGFTHPRHDLHRAAGR